MSESLTEVWRVAGGMAAANGLYESEDIARTQHTLNQAAGFKGSTLERLPLVTPEMVAVIETAIQVDSYRAANKPANMDFVRWYQETAGDYTKAHDAHLSAVRALLAARAISTRGPSNV